MKCQRCDNPATFHITELTTSEPQEVHLCEECARDYLGPGQVQASDVAPVLAGMLAQQITVGHTAEELARLDRRACPVCGISFLEFRKQGRLGCPNDYEFFKKELAPLLLNIHGESNHIGKVPRRCPSGAKQQTRLIRLRREMKEAVAEEKYERASELRDEIRSIEAKLRAARDAGKPAE